MAQTKAQLLNPLNGSINVSGIVTSGGFKVGTGISIVGSGVAATAFYGDGSNLTNVVNSVIAGDNISVSGSTGNVTITGLANTSNVIADTVSTGTLNVTGISTFTGNVSVGGTLTYEDVTNVDSIGIITARSGVRITTGGLIVTAGISTFKGADFDGGSLLKEKINITAGKLSDNTDINLDNGMVHFFTTTETTTSTPNITSSVGINTQMSIGDALAVTIITTAAAAGYSTCVNIDGAYNDVEWLGGTDPSTGGASGKDLYALQVIKTGIGTFTVLGNLSNFA